MFHHVGGIERQFLGVATARMTERPCSGASDPRSRVPRRDGPETSGDGRPAQSRSIEHRLTQGARHSDPGKADLDAHGLDRVHLLGNSLGGRIAIELACRHRALSVVSISPCGLGAPLERAHQGAMMITARMINRVRYPWLDELARTPAGRSVLLAGMRAMPWQASPAEALTMKRRIRRPDRVSGPPCGTRS